MTAAALATRRVGHPRLALVLGLAGLALSGIGFLVDPRQAYASWLAAFAAGLSTVLGALILVAVTHVTGARWFDPLRGAALDAAGTLPLFALLFLVLVPGVGRLYPWAAARPPVNGAYLNGAYLNEPFFLARAAAYFALWIAVGRSLRRPGGTGAREASHPPSARERAIAAVSLPALGLSLTFAAFDWLMSLAPGWVSTVFGVYWFAGGFLAALALVALVSVARLRGAGNAARLPDDQAYALGTLMLTFAIFWGYIAYCQYFVIWIADVPAEVAWYAPRVRAGWGALALVLLGGQLVLPFLVLVSHAAKLNPRIIALAAAWLLAMHYLDSYWLVLPQVHPTGPAPHWLDLAAVATVAGSGLAWAQWRRA